MAKKQIAKKCVNTKKMTLEELVDRLIARCVKAIDNKTMKVTVADLIRVRELQQEIAPFRAANSTVKWVESWD